MKNDVHTLRKGIVRANGLPFSVMHQGSGPAVLFCHGFPDTADTWRRQMRAVSDAGYRAIALDMRGFGESYAPDQVDLYSALHTAGDLVGILDAFGIEQAVVVGHDWGADVAQRAAVMRPDRFAALVTMSIPPSKRGDVSFYGGIKQTGRTPDFYAFDLMKAGAESDFEPSHQSIPSVLFWLSASPAAELSWDPSDPARHMLRRAPVSVPEWADAAYVEHLIAAFARTGFRGGLNYYLAAQLTFDLMTAFKGAVIKQPSLYIWGAQDGLCRFFHPQPPSVEDLRKDAPGLLDVICIEGAGHWLQHEAHHEVSAELLKFLERIGWSKGSVR